MDGVVASPPSTSVSSPTTTTIFCGYPTKAGGVCRQPGSPCKYHAPGAPMARIGQAALQAQKAADVYVNMATRRTIERTYQSVARALADKKISVDHANAIFRACDGRVRMLDLRLQEREEALMALERPA